MIFSKLKKPYVIAEIGINHEGNYSTAQKLVLEAKKAGANAVKFQVFKPDTLAVQNSRKNRLQKKTSGNEDLSSIWKRVSLSLVSLKKLRNYSKKLKIDFICTAFDFESLKLVKKLKLDAIKIASSDITDLPLLSEISKLKKPIILSTGMSNSKEISTALNLLKNKNISILHCVSLYPCNYHDANLNRILALKAKFKKYIIGYSDHCKNFEASIYAINLGANVIEKHFTLNKKKLGLDHSLSADPKDLKVICDYAKNFTLLPGVERINPFLKERKFTKYFRKGIYVNKKLNKNQIIEKNSIIIRRPENKTKPKMYSKLIGKITKSTMNIHDPIDLKKIY
tara:strand:+ start:999 stop:2015 length:1017 start_codon:yes stop_codon:yes gene_type:complete